MPGEKDLGNPMTLSAAVTRQNRLMDEHRFPEACELTAKLLGDWPAMPEIYRRLLISDRIYLDLVGIGSGDEVEVLLDGEQGGFMKLMKDFPGVIRTEFALAFLRSQDVDEAAALRGRFDEVSRTCPYAGDIASERDLMDFAESAFDDVYAEEFDRWLTAYAAGEAQGSITARPDFMVDDL